jgi:coenzyme F420 hydrogenase subunit beta
VGELADVVCGDAWHLRQGQPSFEESPGQSLILARTAGGSRVLAAAQEAGYIDSHDFELESLGLIQPYQKKRRQAIAARLLAMRLAGRPVPRFQGFYLYHNAWQGGPLVFMRQFGGMLRRVMINRQRPAYHQVNPRAEDLT